jgi:hypothetical protein
MKITCDHDSAARSDHGKLCIMALGPLVWRDDSRLGEGGPGHIQSPNEIERSRESRSEERRSQTAAHSELAGDRNLMLLGSAFFYVFSRTSADPDLWGHVRFRQDLWQTGRIVREDVYSYLTGDQLWINHEWLSEAIFYFAFATAGAAGGIAFKSGLALLIVAFLYWHLRQVPRQGGCLVETKQGCRKYGRPLRLEGNTCFGIWARRSRSLSI